MLESVAFLKLRHPNSGNQIHFQAIQTTRITLHRKEDNVGINGNFVVKAPTQWQTDSLSSISDFTHNSAQQGRQH